MIIKAHEFSNKHIHSSIYKQKSIVFELNDCIIDLREFGNHAEFEQNKNIKVYCDGYRLKKYINRNPDTNALWYNETLPTIDFEQEFIDKNDIPIDCKLDSLFFLYDYLEWQYSHFLTDVYPKLWYFKELKKIMKDIQLGQIRPILNFAFNLNDITLKTKLNLVSDFSEDLTDFYLNKNGFKHDFVPLNIGKTFFVKRLFVPVPFTSQDVINWPDVQYEMYSELKQESLKATNDCYDKVFISRNDTVKNGWFNHRYCVNETDISTELNNIGFKSVELIPLKIFEKIKLYSNVKQIVQHVGSNCFNSVFMEPNTDCYIFIHPHYECWMPMLTYLIKKVNCNFIPIQDGIEILGTDKYPPEYTKLPDQPWRYNKYLDLKNIIKI